MKFGRYRITFTKYSWGKIPWPYYVRRFLCFWVLKEARPWDLDDKPQFPPGTPMEYEGRRYRYWKPTGKNIV